MNQRNNTLERHGAVRVVFGIILSLFVLLLFFLLLTLFIEKRDEVDKTRTTFIPLVERIKE